MWFLVVSLFIVLILKSILDYRRPDKFPPGPRGLPIIGNILDIGHLVKETKYLSHVWCRLAEIYGPIVGLRLGMSEPVIIVSGKDAIVEMLNRPEFDGRPNAFLFRHRSGGVRRGLIFTDGNVWSDHRRFTVKTLKRFGFGKVTMEDMILHDAVALSKVVGRMAKEGLITNLRSVISVAVISSLWSLIAGARFDVEKENPKLKDTINVLNDAIKSSNVLGGIMNYFPFMRHLLPGLIGFTAFDQRLTRINSFFMNVISEHKNRRKEDDTLKDFIDVYLEEMNVQKTNPSLSSFDENQLLHVVKDLFTAGVDTTNNTISFAITFLTVHQNAQMKVYDEIDRVVGKDAIPCLADKNRLPYLNATLAEVARMANIGPTSVPHRAVKDTNLLGFEIKKNYSLLANFRSVHMDKNHWGDPKVFRPERFIDSEGRFVEDTWLLPFGLGRRRCLGEGLARSSVFLFTACLLQKFHFVLPDDHPEPCLEGIDGFIVTPPNMDIVAIQRT